MAIEELSSVVSPKPAQRRLALPGPGIVLECTSRGALLKIQRDDLGLLDGITPGISFLHLLHRDSLDKAHAFLTELKNRTSAFGWELKVSLTRQATTLFIGGTLKHNRLLIFGTRTKGTLLRFSRSFLDRGLLSAVNQAIREHIGLAPNHDARESDLLEQLTCANHKLINLQRILARKTTTLERLTAELQEARTGIHTLQQLLPICSSCKQIRDEQGIWHHIENYFKDHAGVQFTHSICPVCVQALYPGLRLETK